MSADKLLQEHAVLDVTYVLYDENSHLSHLLALLTLSPILLNPAYAVLAMYTREIIFVEMWAGQLACEAFNWVLKHIIKEDRPNVTPLWHCLRLHPSWVAPTVASHQREAVQRPSESLASPLLHCHAANFISREPELLGPGYGFPSSHSQWMGYFATFLICHFAFRHRFITTGSRLLDRARDFLLYAFIVTWAAAVAYSRYHLTYHSARQVLWGVAIGVLCGIFYYALVEYIPTRYPSSIPGRIRTSIITHPVLVWFRVRDGWSVYPDGGTEEQWQAWKHRWDAQQIAQEGNAGHPETKKKVQ